MACKRPDRVSLRLAPLNPTRRIKGSEQASKKADVRTNANTGCTYTRLHLISECQPITVGVVTGWTKAMVNSVTSLHARSNFKCKQKRPTCRQSVALSRDRASLAHPTIIFRFEISGPLRQVIYGLSFCPSLHHVF